jgi:hypothetical protein
MNNLECHLEELWFYSMDNWEILKIAVTTVYSTRTIFYCQSHLREYNRDRGIHEGGFVIS